MTSKELYAEFLKSFPSYEPMVDHVLLVTPEKLQIFTKQGKSFIFELHNGDIQLKSV